MAILLTNGSCENLELSSQHTGGHYSPSIKNSDLLVYKGRLLSHVYYLKYIEYAHVNPNIVY